METSHGKFTLSMILYRVIRVVVVLAIAVLLACWLIFTKKEPEKNEVTRTPPAVKIMIVKPVSKMMTVDAFGTVKPRKSVKIAVEVPGRIVFLHPSFIEGGEIQKGELLVRIDPESYQLEKSAAQVRVSQARTDIENFNQEIYI